MNQTKRCETCKGSGRVPNPVAVGASMRRRRERAGIGLREMARRVNMTAAYLSDLELGRRAWRNTRLRAEYEAL